jgi:hypothetical protein
MMKNILTLLFVIALTACDHDQVGVDSNKNDKSKTQLEKTLSTQMDALEKSKRVEKDLQENLERR